jgi:hypothetical protein
MNTKRKRGGQTGNQNARKHGFYSLQLSPSEMREYLNLVNSGLDREVALLRIKLKSLLFRFPDNQRVIMEAAKLLAGSISSSYQLGQADSVRLKKFIRGIFIPP